MQCPGCFALVPDADACFQCGRPLPGGPTIVKGSIIGRRYTVRELLGAGGMGTVYRAHDSALREEVALKVLRHDRGTTPALRERFRAEIRLARRVVHPNVCRIYEYGEEEGIQFISMELVDGCDLRRLLGHRELSASEAVALVVPLARALQAIHEVGIVHRDLKTANAMFDRRSTVRLMDFGIAKQLQGRPGSENDLANTGAVGGSQLTDTGAILGSVDYMSPEQARGGRVDPRSDIYALGIVLFELCTRRLPFRAESPVATLMKHIHDPPPLDVAGVPEALRDVLRIALAKEPGSRYPSAAEMSAHLETAFPAARLPPYPNDLPSGPLPAALPASPSAPTAERDARSTPAPAEVVLPAPPPAGESRPGPQEAARTPRSLAGRAALAILASVAAVFLALHLQPPEPEVAPAPAAPPRRAARAVPVESGGADPAPSEATLPPAPSSRPAPTDRNASRRPGSDPAPAAPGASLAAAGVFPVPAAESPVISTASGDAGDQRASAPTPAPPESRVEPAAAIEVAYGLLVIAVRPAATIEVDGASVATEVSARTVRLSAGPHHLVIRNPAYEPLERPVFIRGGVRHELNVDLRREGIRRDH